MMCSFLIYIYIFFFMSARDNWDTSEGMQCYGELCCKGEMIVTSRDEMYEKYVLN